MTATDDGIVHMKFSRYTPWGRIHTAACLAAASPYSDEGCYVGDRDGGCVCDGVTIFIRSDDEQMAPTLPYLDVTRDSL